MTPINLPGETPDDFAKLQTLLMQAAMRGMEIASVSQRHDFFQALRELIEEKDLSGDQIAVDTLNWAYEEIANRIPLIEF